MKKISSGCFLQWLRFLARGKFKVLVRDGGMRDSWTHLQGFTKSTATRGTIPSDRNPGLSEQLLRICEWEKYPHWKGQKRLRYTIEPTSGHSQKKVSLGTRRETLLRWAQEERKDEQWEREFGREEGWWLLSTFLQVEIGCLARGGKKGWGKNLRQRGKVWGTPKR